MLHSALINENLTYPGGGLDMVEFTITSMSGETVGIIDVTNKGFSYSMDDSLDEFLGRS